MSFTSYLIQPFQNTHENVFFRRVVGELNIKYVNDENKNILIGNLSCGGHLLDAVFISIGKIIIIDFKDYEGKLEFSENNPWKMYKDNDFIFVSGGGGIRNPYQQVNAYRFSLMNILSTNQNQILSPNHIDIRWDHINCMVLFHNTIQFNNNSIPERINRFFTVADQTNYLTSLYDRVSNYLQLNNNEIEKILSVLDVRPENIFNENEQPQSLEHQDTHHRGERLDFVKRHTKDVTGLNEEQRILEYYRTILNLEKFKESKCENFFRYNIDLTNSLHQFELDISANQNFYAEYLQNGQQQFPQNVFIGINITSDNETLTLFQNIILRTDIDNTEKINIKLSDFNIYSKILENKGLSEDIIDDLVLQLNECETLFDKIEMVKNKLEWEIKLANYISVGLSNESPFNSQLVSELRSITRFNNLHEHNLFYSFLRNEKINEPSVDFDFSPMILITDLNYAQRRSIKLAFNQPLTLITGPPGTGKTQVVINLIANAIVNNKTILFASKNNKAVDNVRLKLQKLLKEGDYVLRFGTKTEVRDSTKPLIERFCNRIQSHQMEDRQTQFSDTKNNCVLVYKRVRLVSKELSMIPKLETAINFTNQEIKNLSIEIQNWSDSLEEKSKELFYKHSLSLKVNKNDLSFYINKLRSFAKYTFTRWFYNFFLRNKYYVIFKNIHDSQHPDIKKYLEQNILIQSPQLKPLESNLEYLQFLFNLKKQNDEIEERLNTFTAANNKLKEKFENYNVELNKYKLKEKELLDEFNNLLIKMPDIGLEYLNEYVNQKLFNTDTSSLTEYNNYIPDNIPWQQQNIPQFILANKEFLSNFNAVIVTNLSVKNGFPLEHKLFDLVVIDEASQCDVASAVPLILRAKKFVVIGDPLQLTHITNVEKYEEDYVLHQFNLTNKNFNYVENSLYKFCENIAIRSNFESVFLNEHFRSHNDIITYSKINFYLPKLGQDLIIKTSPDQFVFEPKGITWKNVKGQIHRNRNENWSEIETCLELAKHLHSKYPDATIGITTPYKHQAESIRNKLPKDLQGLVIADNVHKYQGDERDIMIFSVVLCDGVPLKKANWINYKVPYLLNVAVTRAKSSLIIVGDFNYCRSLTQRGPTPLSQLANYVYSLNRVEGMN